MLRQMEMIMYYDDSYLCYKSVVICYTKVTRANAQVIFVNIHFV